MEVGDFLPAGFASLNRFDGQSINILIIIDLCHTIK